VSVYFYIAKKGCLITNTVNHYNLTFSLLQAFDYEIFLTLHKLQKRITWYSNKKPLQK